MYRHLDVLGIHRNRERHGMVSMFVRVRYVYGSEYQYGVVETFGPPFLLLSSTGTRRPPTYARTPYCNVSAHTDGSETHHLPVTLSGVAWVRRQGQGQVGPGSR